MLMQVHLIVATQILEEGLDVPTCNLIIRFDPSATVCSFIQSRGRARMQNSDYVLLVKRHVFISEVIFVSWNFLFTLSASRNLIYLVQSRYYKLNSHFTN